MKEEEIFGVQEVKKGKRGGRIGAGEADGWGKQYPYFA